MGMPAECRGYLLKMTWLYYFAAAGFGLIFGSFFNVIIYRLPRDLSLGERSVCPHCGVVIRWYDNIPILSYCILRARCRRCGERISLMYPLVEAVTAGLFVLVYWWSRATVPADLGLPPGQVFTPELFIGLLLVCILLVASAVDLTFGIVPNRVMYPGLVAMLLLVTALGLYRGQPGRIGIAVAAGTAGGLFLLGIGLLYGFLFMRRAPRSEGESRLLEDEARQDSAAEKGGHEDDEEVIEIPTGIGMGDVKLIAFCGLALGYFHWYLIIVQLVIGFLLGALTSIPLVLLKRSGRRDRIPFAPFLAAGAVIALIWGQQLSDLYLKLLR